MSKPKLDRGAKIWATRTCPVCKKRFQTTKTMEAHQITSHRPPPNPTPEPVNQMSTMAYSQEHHIHDLQVTRRKIIDTAGRFVGAVVEIALERI